MSIIFPITMKLKTNNNDSQISKYAFFNFVISTFLMLFVKFIKLMQKVNKLKLRGMF